MTIPTVDNIPYQTSVPATAVVVQNAGVPVLLSTQIDATNDAIQAWLRAKNAASGDTELYARIAADGDSLVAGLVVNAVQRALNASGTLETWRNNQSLTLLSSAARTTTAQGTTIDQVNYNARGIEIWVVVTAVPSVETLTWKLQAKDPASGTYIDIATHAIGAATGTYKYLVYPGAAGGAGSGFTQITQIALPRDWRVQIAHSASGSFTYSVGAHLIV
jgi:hypothetical protein